MLHRFLPPAWAELVVSVPLALVSILGLLISPDVLMPLAGCFAGGFFVWWSLDSKPWHRRVGYALVSMVLGAGFGYAGGHLTAWFLTGWPVQANVGVYILATLISVYVARGIRGVAKAWTDDPEELAELIKDILHRIAGRGVRRPSAAPRPPGERGEG
ncbi:hypothetical protein ABWI01_03320 [Oceanicaulis alexandrii]|uniref:hypothetical protein n=1 Tax=Oceanicaulis alexandrii TaxID=153233 RepID=UPI0035CFD2C6